MKPEIVDRVKNRQEVPYRPVPPDGHGSGGAPSGVIQVMQKCWQEEPAARPTFEEIRKLFRGINKGRYD